MNEITDAIRRYIAQHPNASDGVAGVQRWWLSDTDVGASFEMIEEALDRLAERGVMVKHRLPDGRTIYSARQANASDACEQ